MPDNGPPPMWQAAELLFPADHPTAAGHFPANPIIPGALLLDQALAAITGNGGNGFPGSAEALHLRTVKFLQPVRPGETLHLRWQISPGDTVKFECRLAGQTAPALTGTLEPGATLP